jgi:outer membrane protein assembly factor BamB
LEIETDWKSHPPKLLWKNPIGPAWSSMIVVGDRLFTQEQRGEIEAITCYSTKSGEQLWASETKDRFEEALGGVGPRATPAFADGKIYALSARGRLECVDARTGKSLWSVDAMKDHQGRLPVWGYSVSPVVADGKVIVFIGGEKEEALAAYEASTGEPAWTTKAGTESYASPIAMTIAGQEQVLYLGDSKLVSVEPASGKVLWEFASPAGRGRPCCQPQLVGQDRLLISFSPDSLIQISVALDGDTWTAKEVWTTRDIKPDYSDYLVYDGYIYGFDGNIFCCVDLATGKKKWKQGRYGAGQALLLPQVPAVLVTTEKGELVLLACNPEKHTELARLQAIEGKSWNHQTICRGKLYVRNAEQMACFQLPIVKSEEIAAK